VRAMELSVKEVMIKILKEAGEEGEEGPLYTP
jgi:hypothetical protein